MELKLFCTTYTCIKGMNTPNGKCQAVALKFWRLGMEGGIDFQASGERHNWPASDSAAATDAAAWRLTLGVFIA